MGYEQRNKPARYYSTQSPLKSKEDAAIKSDLLLDNGNGGIYENGLIRGTRLIAGAGMNFTEVQEDGTLRFNGDATYWNDVLVPMTSAKAPASGAPDFQAFRGNMYAWAFDKNTEQSLHFTAQFGHHYKLKSPVEVHVHWSPGNSTDLGQVYWQLEYSWADIGDAFPATSTVYSYAGKGSGTPYDHILTELSDDIGNADGISSILIGMITRKASNAQDNFDDDAYLLHVDFHIECDTLGSREEYIK